MSTLGDDVFRVSGENGDGENLLIYDKRKKDHPRLSSFFLLDSLFKDSNVNESTKKFLSLSLWESNKIIKFYGFL